MKKLLTRCLAVAAVFATATGWAQSYPSRPIRIIVPTAAGGPTDFTARAIGQRMAEAWGQQIIIDNRGGAGGIIAHDLASKATPDGYTLIFSTAAGLIINPLLNKLSYDPFRDFAPISLGSVNPQMLFTHPSVPATNVKELIALAKAAPKQLNCASAGNGTPNHLGCELLKSMAEIDVVHVPYKGSPPAVTDVVSGRIQFMLNSIPTVAAARCRREDPCAGRVHAQAHPGAAGPSRDRRNRSGLRIRAVVRHAGPGTHAAGDRE